MKYAGAQAMQHFPDIVGTDKPLFEKLYTVGFEDLDELHHANNTSYVRWLQTVTAAHNAAFGLGQDFLISTNVVFVVIDYALKYLRPSKVNDQISLKTCVLDFNRFSHTRFYEVSNVKDGTLLFKGTGRWVSMDLRSEKLVRMPNVHFDRMGAMAAQVCPAMT